MEKKSCECGNNKFEFYEDHNSIPVDDLVLICSVCGKECYRYGFDFLD